MSPIVLSPVIFHVVPNGIYFGVDVLTSVIDKMMAHEIADFIAFDMEGIEIALGIHFDRYQDNAGDGIR